MTVKKEENAVTYCQTFTFNASDQKVNPILIDSNPFFIAVEVCEMLDISNPTVALRALDDDEKLTYEILRSGQMRKVNLVNESGLYNLIFRSNKPEARLFRKWVTNEVLPAIRKNGYFDPLSKISDPEQKEVADLVIKAIKIAGTQSILARYLRVSESVLSEIRTRPGKITKRLCMKVAAGCREVLKHGEVPEDSLRIMDVSILNQMWFDIALIESYDVRRRITRLMKKLIGRPGIPVIVNLSQEGGRS